MASGIGNLPVPRVDNAELSARERRRTSPECKINALNAIKYLGNTLKIPIVAFGTEVAVTVIQSDPRHARRFTVERLPLWQPDRRFQRMLESFEMSLPP